ncbi:MAG: hypothetical protein HY744_17810 [Deltaproteobacteria bacterium]|nr:hypothetical protein [Deltaproteobacteria bacterium]
MPEVLRPGSRPMFAVAGFGPSFFGLAGKYGRGAALTRFRLTQEFGYHFSHTTEGPAIGASIAESFGWGFVGFQPGCKFWWDIQPVKNLGVYIAPTGKLGYALFAGGGAAHGINFEFGAEGRLVLGDRGFVFLRPISADMVAVFAPAADFLFDWDVSLGGGLIF